MKHVQQSEIGTSIKAPMHPTSPPVSNKMSGNFSEASNALLKESGADSMTEEIEQVRTKIRALFVRMNMTDCDLLVRSIHEDAVVYIGETQKEYNVVAANEEDDGMIKAPRQATGTKIEVTRKVTSSGIDIQRKITFDPTDFSRNIGGAAAAAAASGATHKPGYSSLSIGTSNNV